ncbi:MAG: hypothetical protein ACOZF0_17305 [Thermodesulfobacteriota bacterium]
MYQVRIDKDKNRIYISATEIYRREARKFAELIKEECQKLKPGFTCITDLRRLRRQLGKIDRIIYDVQTMLAKAGMSKVVRVVDPEAADVEMQFEAISVLKVGYSAYTTTSMRIAEEILDKQ